MRLQRIGKIIFVQFDYAFQANSLENKLQKLKRKYEKIGVKVD